MNIVSHYLKRVSEIPTWLLVVTFGFPVIAIGLGYNAPYWLSIENTRTVLSTLAGAEAAVIAILFSVTLVGIQLIASRYSSRMTFLFTDSPILILTFLVFVISIGFNLYLLYILPTEPGRLLISGIYVAGSLGFVSAAWLIVFIREMTHRSTPEGALEAFKSYLTPWQYIDKVKKTTDSETERAHPLRPLYSMVMSALSNREHVTAKMALEDIETISLDVLSALKEEQQITELDRDVWIGLYKPVLQDHLPDIASYAEERDEAEIVGIATNLQAKIGKEAIESGSTEEERDKLDRIGKQAGWGLHDVIRDSPVESGEYHASNSAWRNLGELLKVASEEPRPDVAWAILNPIDDRVRTQIWRTQYISWYRHSMRQLYDDLRESHEKLLDHYGEDLADLGINWQYEAIPDDVENRKGMDTVKKCRKALLKTSETFLSNYQEEYEPEEEDIQVGEYQLPIIEGNFKNSWKRTCLDACESPAENYAVVLTRGLIEVTYMMASIRDENPLFLIKALSDISEDHQDIVEEAFDGILKYSHKEEEPTLRMASQMGEHIEKYYQNLINVEHFSPLNTHEVYPELLKQIQKEVKENR